MLKSWMRFSNGVNGHETPAQVQAILEPEPPQQPERLPARRPHNSPAETLPTFAQIYAAAAVKPPQASYGILKLAEMANSAHLAGMTPEAKRCSLLMALEAAGAEIEDLLQDAVVRQRALNDFEEAQQRRLAEFEAVKTEENRRIQAELDQLTTGYLSRIQANLDELAREQDRLRAWQKAKQQESQRITEAATYCVPQGAPNAATLTAVLERATFSHK